MTWIPPFLAPGHCARCVDGWMDQALCPRLRFEQRPMLGGRIEKPPLEQKPIYGNSARCGNRWQSGEKKAS